jgi:hypothetical protein
MFTTPLTTLAALMLAGASVTAEPLPTAPLPHAAKVSSIYKLRNVAAADVAFTLNTHFKSVVVTAEPVSNSLLVSAAPVQQQQILKLIADMDRAAPQFVITMLIIKAKSGFAEETGIAEKKDGNPENQWVLSPREVRMFSGSIRQAKLDEGIDFLSRPMLQVAENQTGMVQVNNGNSTISVRVTPRLMPDGRILMRAETQYGEPNAKPLPITDCIADGSTLIVRGQPVKMANGDASEMLYVLTVHVVK